MEPLEQGKPNNMGQRVGENMSVLNPTDRAMMKQSGAVTPETPIREYFGMLGIDVDGPMSQLAGAMKDQMAKADPVQKMQRLAGGGPGMGQPAPMPQGGGMPQGAPQGKPGGDLKSLLGRM